MKPLIPILTLSILLTGRAMAHVAVDEMAAAANKFLGALKPDQAQKASFQWKDDERQNWHYIPKTRKGLTIKDMAADQRQLAMKLLRSGLSDHGYGKATNIMGLEIILKELEGPSSRMVRDPEMYYVTIFGDPVKTPWGWRVEGHHLSINFTVVSDTEITSSPTFFGSNPGEVREGPRKGLSVLGEEQEMGRRLVNILTEEQKHVAIFSNTPPKDIVTGKQHQVSPCLLTVWDSQK